MLDFKIVSTKGRIYKITHEQREIASLSYEKWSNRDAEIKLVDGTACHVCADKLFNNIIEIKQDERVIGRAEPNFKGGLILTFFSDGETEVFLFSKADDEQNKYRLLDSVGNESMLIQLEFHWKTMQFYGNITLVHDWRDWSILPIALYCANIFRSSYMGNTDYIAKEKYAHLS